MENNELPRYKQLSVVYGKDRAQEIRVRVVAEMEDDVNKEHQQKNWMLIVMN